ncbi:hypothetical protein [Defluviitalea phaphyphila]|uniref:hypothetical protein n=1 Tax=Defluviitalea phaphyphila TaxID=1473580 RepID=UPI000731D9E5|nr:hypothetical protein [Defluviitalea phaphyphila]
MKTIKDIYYYWEGYSQNIFYYAMYAKTYTIQKHTINKLFNIKIKLKNLAEKLEKEQREKSNDIQILVVKI